MRERAEAVSQGKFLQAQSEVRYLGSASITAESVNLILGDFALLPPLLSHCPVVIHFRVSACTSQSHPKNLLSGCEEPLTSSVFVRRRPDRVHTQTSTATRHACAAAAHNKAGLSHPSAFHRGSCISILLFSKRNCRQLKSS